MANNLNARFAMNPVALHTKRSRFDIPFNHKGTFNTGELVLFDCKEIYPGDTFSIRQSVVLRGSTPIHPVMDNAFFDLYWFFVPMRLVWDKTKEFFGENTNGPWYDEVEYEIPQVVFDEGYVIPFDGLADDIGLPAGLTIYNSLSVSALPARAYTLIWNEWFRDQNTQSPAYLNKGSDPYDVASEGDEPSAYGSRLKLNKYHDYFTSALIEPQKGPAVSISLASDVPVYTGEEMSLSEIRNNFPNSMTFAFSYGDQVFDALDGPGDIHFGSGYSGAYINSSENRATLADAIYPSNLWARLSNVAVATVNTLRQAFAIQALYEIDARSGTRYRESIKGHFGITISDKTVQVPEYLGGRRLPVNVNQVLQTSSTDSTSPQGNTGAYSLTTDSEGIVSKSFEEHGFLICVGGIRTVHTYQQGVPVYLSRKRRFDFYYPELANLGELPVKNKVIYAIGDDEQDEETFGFNEAWAELRYQPSYVSGSFRSSHPQSLDIWHYADYFEELPVLNDEFMKETATNVDRTLAVQSSEHPQWLYDLQIDAVATRILPLYSIPGLSSHA